MSKTVIDDMKIFSNNSYNEGSNEENSDDSDEEISDEKILIKKIKYINLFLEKIRKIWEIF